MQGQKLAAPYLTQRTQSVPISVMRDRSDFLRLRNGFNFSGKNFIIQCASRNEFDREIRVGFTVTKKVGSSVVRNRIKRRFREAVRTVFQINAKPGFDYVLIARRAALRSDFKFLTTELSTALDQIHSRRAKGSHN